jgi:DNA-binding response OmpR family regulator
VSKASNAQETEAKRPLILLVEDDSVNALAVSRTLEREGYAVKVAGSGQEALLWLQTETPDLLLLDVELPDVCGLDLCQIVKRNERLRRVPVVFQSCRDEVQQVLEGHDAGGVVYLTKPYRMQRLLTAVKVACRQSA